MQATHSLGVGGDEERGAAEESGGGSAGEACGE